MDNTILAIISITHMVFGGIVGVLISNIFDNILLKRLEKQLEKAVDDMFDKDLELDHLAEEVKNLTNEVNELRSKFPVVEPSDETDAYLSDSSTEADNKD
jgi:hypothetical protein